MACCLATRIRRSIAHLLLWTYLATWLPIPATADGSLQNSPAFPAPASAFPKDGDGDAGRQLDVTGDQELLSNLRWWSTLPNTGPFASLFGANSSQQSLSLSGALDKNFSLDATVKKAPQETADTLWSLRYDNARTHMQFGAIPATVQGNDFSAFNHPVQGIQIDSLLNRGSLTGIISTIKPIYKSDHLIGENSRGPFMLSASPITPNSEVVMVNGRRLVRDQEYSLDTTAGTLILHQGERYGSADRIDVTYEVMDQGLSGGSLLALRGIYPINQVNVGVSYVALTGTHHTGASERSEQDHFLGENLPGPFYLSYRPVVENTDVLTVDGKVLQRGEGYTLDYTTGKVFFLGRYVPTFGAAVDIRYRVVASPPADTDRAVTGIDMDLQNGKGLSANLQLAQSSGSAKETTVIPMEVITDEEYPLQQGVATGGQIIKLIKQPIRDGSETVRTPFGVLVRNQDYTLDYQTGELHLLHDDIAAGDPPRLLVSYQTLPKTVQRQGNMASSARASYMSDKLSSSIQYRQVSPGFMPLDPVVDSSTEHSLDWSTTYAPSQLLTLSTTGSTALLAQPMDGDTPDNRLQQVKRTYSLDFHHPVLPSLLLQRSIQRFTQVGDPQFGDATTTDTLTSSWSKKAFAITSNLEQMASENRQEGFQYRNISKSAGMNMSYQYSSRGDIAVALSSNRIASESNEKQTKTGGNGMQFTANYRPSDTLSYTANLQRSTTQPVKGTEGIEMPSQLFANLTLGVNWHPFSAGIIGLQYSENNTTTAALPGTGQPYSYQSRDRILSLDATYHPGDRVDAGVHLARSRNRTETDGSLLGLGETSVSANTAYRPSQTLSFTGDLHATFRDPTIAGNTASPSQWNTKNALGGEWQFCPPVSLALRYSAEQNTDGVGGKQGYVTKAAEIQWRPSDIKTLNGYLIGQTRQTFTQSILTDSYLAGCNISFMPRRYTTIGAYLQHLWGENADGITQLWLTEGLSRNGGGSSMGGLGFSGLADTSLTSFGGTLTYQPNELHDLSLFSELMLAGRLAYTPRYYAFGIGWHYHASPYLRVGLDTHLFRSLDTSGLGLAYGTRDINFDLDYQF